MDMDQTTPIIETEEDKEIKELEQRMK